MTDLLPARFNSDLEMRQSVFFDGPTASQKYSRFWLLLVLAAVIASAGVVADSTATVIGAMIVAPLMTPILGTMLATVLGDRDNLIRSLLLVIGGAAAAIAIGFLVGVVVVPEVLAETNTQVAGRVSPGLIDLLAALGTGVVGSVALVRKDISDTLPGVAIALALSSLAVVVRTIVENGVHDAASTWADEVGWTFTDVTSDGAEVHVRLEGPMPLPQTGELIERLADAGVDADLVTVEFVPVYTVELK